jgi:T4-like virus tail tube protein gp19
MTEFTVNPTRFDPYKNFKFRIKWDGKYVAGLSKMTALKRTTQVVKYREGGDPSSSRKSPGITEPQNLQQKPLYRLQVGRCERLPMNHY